MSYILLLPRRRHWSVFGGRLIANALGLGKATENLRGGALLSPASNGVPGSPRMGVCTCVVESFRQTFGTICRAAKVLGNAVCKCLGRCCICSDCLPSSEAVGSCVGRLMAFVILVVCCPCLCCWCICKAIILFRGRNQDPGDQTRRGYNTFDNDAEQNSFDGIGHSTKTLNYLFYSNKIPSKPNGALIDDILNDWYRDYDRLENHHGFIQWLFPLYESGVNYHAEPLTPNEQQLILDDPEAYQRIRRSCRLMLDFYGINFDESMEELSRNENYRERFHNLNRHSHNNLRITRIIKCLVIFNYHQLAKSIVKFFITEICKEGNLPNCWNSCRDFWVTALPQHDCLEMQMYINKLDRESKDMQVNPGLEESTDNKGEGVDLI